jgi:hypothetical protein
MLNVADGLDNLDWQKQEWWVLVCS